MNYNYQYIYDILTSNTFIYERCGHDKRDMTFLKSGEIGHGRATMESFWHLAIKKEGAILTFQSPNNELFELKLDNDGIWRGEWPFHERMKITLRVKTVDTKSFDKDFTILIQGPLNSISLENIVNYRKYGNVIVSCWEYDNTKPLDGIDYSFLIVKNEYPHMPMYNSANIHLQLLTCIGGLEYCKTKYCIKVRSDESFSDISPIIRKLREDDSKIISTTVYFCNRPYHPSDHIIAGKTETLLKGFYRSLKLIENPLDNNPLAQQKICLTSERIICYGILWSQGEKPTIENWVELMHKYYDIVPMNQLGDISWKCSGMNVRSDKDNFNEYSHGAFATIHNMKELGVNPHLM